MSTYTDDLHTLRKNYEKLWQMFYTFDISIKIDQSMPYMYLTWNLHLVEKDQFDFKI